MSSFGPVCRSARLREEAYASEIDQILLNNLREAIALQQELRGELEQRQCDGECTDPSCRCARGACSTSSRETATVE